jgi:hypothetical protein
MSNALTKAEILAKLEEIAVKPGFIYTLAVMLHKDLFFSVTESADMDWKKKLMFQEFSLVIGLMVKSPISLAYPTPEQSQKDEEEVRSLFEAFHQAHFVPFTEGLKKHLEEPIPSTKEEKEAEMKSFFGSGDMMAEPIFYAGSGAYDFQYGELAPKKYAHDAAWLMAQKGLTIENSVKFAAKLKHLSQEKARSLFSREHLESVISSFEKYCQFNLDLFSFSKSDLQEFDSREVDAFVNEFSLVAGEVNQGFDEAGKYNQTISHPIVDLENGSYFLPIGFLLSQSIYESPFYWMFQDASYKNKASKNRGDATEEIAFDMLKPIFGDGIFKNVKVLNGRDDETDIDILGVSGNKAVVFQAKSKRLTELARRGDTEKLKQDFSAAVQKAYDQGLVCRKAILTGGSKLIDSEGNELSLSEIVDDVYIVCLTSDDYPALTSQVGFYLTKDTADPPTIAVSLPDLDILSFYLRDVFEFLYYLRQRIDLSDYYKAASEMTYLGMHLNQKLFKRPGYDFAMIDEDMSQLIDANFPVMKGYHPKHQAVERLHHKWKNDDFNALVSQIKSSGIPGFTDAVYFLYDLAGDSADGLIKNIRDIKKRARVDGKKHDLSLIFDKGEAGISVVCQPDHPENLERNLLLHAHVRKYKTKANLWLAFGCMVNDPNIVSLVAFTKAPWTFDEELEQMSQSYLSSGKIMKVDGSKPGRNETCPCGSGKKFKKCCGK